MPRTCLHSVMSQLNTSLQYRGEASPLVLESFYRLIHALAANPKTSEPILRFLRSTDFLKTHLAALPFTNAPTGNLFSLINFSFIPHLFKFYVMKFKHNFMSNGTILGSAFSHYISYFLSCVHIVCFTVVIKCKLPS